MRLQHETERKCQWLLKKFYSDDDIQLAKAALSELPDLTAQRKTLRDFLDAIRDDIIVLVRTKGYTLADVRDTLKNAGYEVGEKALRDIIREAESKKPSRRSSSKTAPKKTDSGRKDGIDMNNN
ncbi:molybdopterin-guanine dinucleotide biosynthesis protein MobC [Salmonella enterica]|uniref:molybdopterin-guanine dinucleotide biosynthesis protein MobC n=1 Tax=Salmonella enterica TaxID=28901 RepID=UPI0008FEDC19|nr:molybdopterin-guanine dinucleotide biosynthesis protein MobC [Salmonella enterica]HBB2571299.1 molybdopterin-guanine dinucleotide biosynthesis protein MobC [Escherichia coli]